MDCWEKHMFLPITVRHAPLVQASYHLARIPICYSHSHQWIKEKAKVSCHYHPTHTPRAAELSSCANPCMLLVFLSMDCTKIQSFLPSSSDIYRQASCFLDRFFCFCFYIKKPHRWTKGKTQASCHHRPTCSPRAGELSPCQDSCILFHHIPIDELTKKLSLLAITCILINELRNN